MSQSQGFHSADLTASIANLRRDFAPWFAVAAAFNELAMRVLPAIKPGTTDNQNWWLQLFTVVR